MKPRKAFSQLMQLMQKPVVINKASQGEELTKRIAYQLYQKRILGAQRGSHLDDWLQAQRIARSPVLRSIHYDKWLCLRPIISLVRFTRWFSSGIIGKTSWELLELLIIPLFLTLGAFYLEGQIETRQENIADERAKQAILTNYLNQMKELLLDKDLRNASEDSEVRSLARAITVTTLRELDSDRNALLIGFLKESQLIQTHSGSKKKALPLLSGLNFTDTKLREVDFSDVDLRDSTFTDVYLYRANFQEANLQDTRFENTNLEWADITEADLRNARFVHTDLRRARLNSSDLRDVWFIGAKIGETRFGKADLRGANFTEINFWRVSFCTARLSQWQEDSFGKRCSLIEYFTPFPYR